MPLPLRLAWNRTSNLLETGVGGQMLGLKRGGVDEAVLAELRGIREQIQGLSEKLGNAAMRDDLADYVRKEAFDAHVGGHQRLIEGWRGWLPVVIACFAVLWNVVGPYIHVGVR